VEASRQGLAKERDVCSSRSSSSNTQQRQQHTVSNTQSKLLLTGCTAHGLWTCPLRGSGNATRHAYASSRIGAASESPRDRCGHKIGCPPGLTRPPQLLHVGTSSS
jgi:hypothetical protein